MLGFDVQESSTGLSALSEDVRSNNLMYATIRRYEGIDQARTDELTKKVGETLIPRLSKVDGFRGYYLIEAGEGVMSSVNFFETLEQADESTRIASNWVRDEKLETALPNPPKVTGGEVIVKKMVEKKDLVHA
jgi:hypothetical protein